MWVIVNKDLWKSFTKEQQKIVRDTFHEHSLKTLDLMDKKDREYAALLKKAGIEVAEYPDKYYIELGAHLRSFEKLWQSYKIAVRNGYEIVDISLWSDYVDTLRRLGKDIHNPKYLCPTDLKAEHDRRHEELLRVREREEIEQKQQKAMEDEKRFKQFAGNGRGEHCDLLVCCGQWAGDGKG